MVKKRRRTNAGNAEAVGAEEEVESGDAEAASTPNKQKSQGVPKHWTLVRRVKEDHGQVLFGLAINLYDERWYNLFATTGANRATVYELLPDGKIEVRQVYVDEDQSESYFCCAWSVAPWCEEQPLLAVAGQLGIIRVLDCVRHNVSRTLMGHGNSVNDLRFHPYQPELLLSASKDESIRLWNVASCVCVALFTGDSAHRGEVLSLDFHLDGKQFVSAGMDNAIKIWSLDQCAPAIKQASNLQHQGAEAQASSRGDATGRFRSAIVQLPTYSTTRIHRNYVDCVRWHGDHILSKSTHNKIVIWKPQPSKAHGSDAALVLGECRYNSSDIWFLRFNIDPQHNFVAVGNKVGQILLWDLTQLVTGKETCKLTHSQCTNTVRQTAISHDGRTVLAATEDGSIWRWDVTR